MDSLWAWLALAGAGALHGMSPAAGWMFVACGARPHDPGGWLRLLVPLAAGQAGWMLWPFVTGTLQAAGPALDDVCRAGATAAASQAATWFPLAAIGTHGAGMLAGTAIAAALARLALHVPGARATARASAVPD
ncbi:MAG TPA: hypothetical protein VF522_19460 [Ramlibacter sp.]|uniref:hypothetical protein n=1 Tax=Ramlibacter sp. TaxID=1917967 RepID=UPI002ED66DBD